MDAVSRDFVVRYFYSGFLIIYSETVEIRPPKILKDCLKMRFHLPKKLRLCFKTRQEVDKEAR